jgi:hypothetical protein
MSILENNNSNLQAIADKEIDYSFRINKSTPLIVVSDDSNKEHTL